MLKLVHSEIGFLSLLYASQFTVNTTGTEVYKECVRQRFPSSNLVNIFFRAVLLLAGFTNAAAPLLIFLKKLVQNFRRRIQQFWLGRKYNL